MKNNIIPKLLMSLGALVYLLGISGAPVRYLAARAISSAFW